MLCLERPISSEQSLWWQLLHACRHVRKQAGRQGHAIAPCMGPASMPSSGLVRTATRLQMAISSLQQQATRHSSGNAVRTSCASSQLSVGLLPERSGAGVPVLPAAGPKAAPLAPLLPLPSRRILFSASKCSVHHLVS